MGSTTFTGSVSTPSSTVQSPSSLSTQNTSPTSTQSGSSSTASGTSQPSGTASQAPTISTSKAPSKLSSSAKIGIGLGVPLGIIILGLIGALLFRFRQHKRGSRLKHHGNMIPDMLYPAEDKCSIPHKNEATGEVQSKEGNIAINELKNQNDTASHGRGPHEMHGDHVPPYSRELLGDLGSGRQELPTRRGSV